ncbi:hypothetical protein PybrP1_000733 [[Pythium] brassicae (nom. inval.)]|nr:hypothetical protein PybrP1_000733 [[Pythium] brassicae (nom. inval.)]
MLNAATKFVFGFEPSSTSHNPNMTKLIDPIRKTVRTVKENETMDNLFEALCQLEGRATPTSSSTSQLTAYLDCCALWSVLSRSGSRWRTGSRLAQRR